MVYNLWIISIKNGHSKFRLNDGKQVGQNIMVTKSFTLRKPFIHINVELYSLFPNITRVFEMIMK